MDHITLSNLTAQNRPNKPDTTCGKAHLDEIRNETLYRRWRIPLEMVASNKANRARWTDYGSANRSAHLEKPRRLGEHALKIQAGPGCPQPSFSSWSALNDRSAGLRMSVGRYLYSLSSGPTQRTEPFEWNQDPEQDTPLDPCRMFRCSLTPQTLPLSPGQSPLCPITSWSTYVNYDDLDIAQWLGATKGRTYALRHFCMMNSPPLYVRPCLRDLALLAFWMSQLWQENWRKNNNAAAAANPHALHFSPLSL